MKYSAIQIVGTSGSGKSYLMRAFLKRLRGKGPVEEVFQEGSERILGYLAKPLASGASLFIPGAYTVPTGGCDTLKNVEEVYGLIEKNLALGHVVVFEGLFCMNQTRGPRLVERLGSRYLVLQLTTPLSVCIDAINDRRAARGAGVLKSSLNTADNYKRSINFYARMRDSGAQVKRITRGDGLGVLMEAVGW